VEVDASMSEQLVIVAFEFFGSDRSVFVVADEFSVDDLQDASRVKWMYRCTFLFEFKPTIMDLDALRMRSRLYSNP
jgi:hypothetical protein